MIEKVEQLIADHERLIKENKKLKDLVLESFKEGFDCGYVDATRHKDKPDLTYWLRSESELELRRTQ